MTTPAIRALKETFSDSQITLMSSSSGIEIAPLVPEIDHTITYNAPWMKVTGKTTTSQVDHNTIAEIRKSKYDAAVIFTVYSQNPLAAGYMCYLADIPLRLAYCRENPYQILSTWVRETEPHQEICHEVERHLKLVKAVGARSSTDKLRVAIPPINFQHIQKILLNKKVELSSPWIVMHPGASAPSRRYPPEYFAEAAKQLIINDSMQIVFSGVRSERGLVQQIQNMVGNKTVSLAGELSLHEMAALLFLAPLLVSNNTGPVHLAAAVNTPVVDLYALTNPQHTPWRVPSKVLNHDVPCKYCYQSICPEGHHNCLRLVTPYMVVTAIRELLSETAHISKNMKEIQ